MSNSDHFISYQVQEALPRDNKHCTCAMCLTYSPFHSVEETLTAETGK